MFKADTYRVLIASPSDLADERSAATEAVNEWNAMHAASEGVVLLPVKWETHATPESGVRPQASINRQLVASSDILVGMFWTKFGTSTGVAESGTVEEIDQFVAAGKPAMLYFSSRPIDPSKIDLEQQKKLRAFKDETYKTALVGGFSSTDDLQKTLLRHLTDQIRQMRGSRRRRSNKLDEATQLAEMMMNFRQNKITPADLHQFRDDLLRPKSATQPKADHYEVGQLGPNGHRVVRLKNGDIAEMIPDDETPGEEWPMILRRNDDDIAKAADEFETVIWYDRKLVLLENIKNGREPLSPEIEKGMLEGMRKAEKKYGKRKIRSYYSNDFEWGMINGKLSALRWVLGMEWDMLDT